MSEPDETAGDHELADFYERGGIDADKWAEPTHVSKPERLDVTISVRFTQTEIASIRSRAVAANLKPTTYIRQCVLAAEHDAIDRAQLTRSVEALARSLEDLKQVTG